MSNAELARIERDLETRPEPELELVLTPDMVNKLVEQATIRQDFFRKMMAVALKGTRPKGWMNFGDNPWPRAPEAERIRRDFGLSILDVEYETEEGVDDQGAWFAYTCRGTMASNVFGRMQVMGHASSRDQFFGMEHGVLKPASEVDRPSVKQAAYSNMLQNGVTRLLGLRGLSWEDLKELSAGEVTREKAATVSFGKKGRAAKDTGAAEGSGGNPGGQQSPKVVDLEARVTELTGGKPEAIAALVKRATSYPASDKYKAFAGFDSIQDLRQRAKDAERIAAIALKKLDELVQSGELQQILKAHGVTPEQPAQTGLGVTGRGD